MNPMNVTNEKLKTVIAFSLLAVLLAAVFLTAVNTGSIQITYSTLFRGLFVEYNSQVAAVYDLRFPRIMIALLAGAGIAVSGVLFQAVLRNPLADPGIIGISSGAAFMMAVVTAFFSAAYYLSWAAALAGALAAFFLIYLLVWDGGLNPVRMILTGVAIQSVFTALTSVFAAISKGQTVDASAAGSMAQKTWSDVRILAVCTTIGLILAIIQFGSCNFMSLEDKTIRSIGININRRRIFCSITGALLAGICAAVVGSISFLGLIAPHMARAIVGNDHKKLLPFSMLLGSFLLLSADTLGRRIAYPYEISAAVIMAVIGGPVFIVLLKRSKNSYER